MVRLFPINDIRLQLDIMNITIGCKRGGIKKLVIKLKKHKNKQR